MTETRPKILIVDDVQANLVALEAVLDGMDCDIVLAHSGNEALRLLLKTPFAAMLLDVQMPEMDGYEVAQHARQNEKTRHVPIIFLTAKHETRDDALRGYGTGAVDFLFKPISPVVLRSKIKVFLELYQQKMQIEQAYADLQLTQAQLVQSAKMAALGELVAGVAHEINNPLAFSTSHLRTARDCLARLEPVVLGQLTPEATADWNKAQNRLKEMHHGLDRISDLVVQLRTFSRLDEGRIKSIVFKECLDSVLMILGHRLAKRIKVELALEGPESFECYPGPLNLALLNLVANAIDAIAEEGTIIISTEEVDGSIVIAVQDDGMGIAEDVQARVFEPFFTTKPVGKGTGLGLSITYSIAQKHGGSLELSSKPGVGTRVSLRFPQSIQTKEA